MKLTLAYSPCPNDTFAFHAMTHGLIDTDGIEFDVVHTDIEELNKKAVKNSFDICKMSYHAFFMLAHEYAMLRSGSALGYGNGPLLVSKRNNINPNNVDVLIPGDKTTATLLLKIAFPEITKTTPTLFSEIERLILEDKYYAGVLIHESRFTYKEKGLVLIEDLGKRWQQISGLPVPLGGIAVSRKLDPLLSRKLSSLIKKSIEFAKDNPGPSANYIKEHATEMSESVIEKHIDMFVNDYTLNIGIEGERAVKALYNKSMEIYPNLVGRDDLFI